jgi:hypothetical protein
MLLRVIRVAEILVKGQDDTAQTSSFADQKSGNVQMDASAGCMQKTQTGHSGVR